MPKLSKQISCGHCNNISAMQICGSASDLEVFEDFENGYFSEKGEVINILACPACHKKNIVSYYWDDNIMEDDDIEYDFLFPQVISFPPGLPKDILDTLKNAEKIKNIDTNIYAITLRRLLEMVCLDRNAKGGTLASKLDYLAQKKEIPDKLVKVADRLRAFGNIGAHPSATALTETEAPIIKALVSAILEYIYSAPFLAELAEKKLKEIKGNSQL